MIIIITGEPGVGKTTVARDIAKHMTTIGRWWAVIAEDGELRPSCNCGMQLHDVLDDQWKENLQKLAGKTVIMDETAFALTVTGAVGAVEQDHYIEQAIARMMGVDATIIVELPRYDPTETLAHLVDVWVHVGTFNYETRIVTIKKNRPGKPGEVPRFVFNDDGSVTWVTKSQMDPWKSDPSLLKPHEMLELKN